MSERRYGGVSAAHVAARIASGEFRQTMRGTGVTMAGAAGRLQEAARHFDLAEFEAQIAAYRPELWKRMNKQPSRLTGVLRRLRIRA